MIFVETDMIFVNFVVKLISLIHTINKFINKKIYI